MVKLLLIFSRCSLALILSAAIELVLMSVDAELLEPVGLTVIFNAFSLTLSSGSPQSVKSTDFIDFGDIGGLFGDLRLKLCAGDAFMLLEGLLIVDAFECGISMPLDAGGRIPLLGECLAADKF